LRTPAFVAELGGPAHRGRLKTGIATGYATCAGFALLAWLADALGVLPLRAVMIVPFAVKVVANTLAWAALRTNKAVLTSFGLNIVADMFAMTSIIYITGGELSPLFPIYLIEVTVIALLGNVGVTVLAAVSGVALYAAMALLVYAGVLPPQPTPAMLAGGVSGKYIAVDVVYAAFVLGVPTYYTARILQDLREKRQALEKRTAALVEAGQQRSQFMANVTHELRTPIHGIFGLSDLIGSGIYGTVSPKQKDALAGIKRSAKALMALIDDLLELSRTDAGKLDLRPEAVVIGDLVPTVVSAARWMIGTKAITVETEVADDLPVVETDPRRLNQVLLNLLSNAAKFTPEGGRVVVRACRDGEGAVRIEVADTGIGIAPEHQAMVFEEFRQVDGSAERAYGGAGLGLAVVRRLSDAMGARIELKSAVGEGATFSVVVPVAWPSAATGAKSAA
jgi:signal transduction histidine kinase